MKYALENPCILFISVFRRLLPQSLQKQLKSTPNCETSKLHLGSHLFLIEFLMCLVLLFVSRDRRRWNHSSILSTAGSGKFSSDRTISQYALTFGTSRNAECHKQCECKVTHSHLNHAFQYTKFLWHLLFHLHFVIFFWKQLNPIIRSMCIIQPAVNILFHGPGPF
jgi:hypothetical protein